MSASANPVPACTRLLGWAGLIPFLALPALVYLYPHHGLVWGDVLASYALAIICFLVGSWWGLALIRRSAAALVLSNVAVLLAFFSHVLLPVEQFLVVCALLFPAILLIERWLPLFRPQPRYYARLRLNLSIIATAGLLLAAYRI